MSSGPKERRAKVKVAIIIGVSGCKFHSTDLWVAVIQYSAYGLAPRANVYTWVSVELFVTHLTRNEGWVALKDVCSKRDRSLTGTFFFKSACDGQSIAYHHRQIICKFCGLNL